MSFFGLQRNILNEHVGELSFENDKNSLTLGAHTRIDSSGGGNNDNLFLI